MGCIKLWIVAALLVAISSLAVALQSRACEHTNLELKCGAGEEIKIESGYYGRTTGGNVCPHSALSNRNCRASSTMGIVRRECDGKNSCTVKASNSVFGDPCRGTFKYLEVNYGCTPVQRSARACEHTNLELKCGAGEEIDIKSGYYGRTTGGNVCPHSALSNQNCRASSTMGIVRRNCDGKNSCTVKASNSVFGDPCRGTFKYLEVNYDCRSVKRSAKACEHKDLVLKCNGGRKIKINSGNYGRTTGGTVCPHSAISNQKCRAKGSGAVLKKACNGKSTCTVKASNGVFGDPCVGTFKYLRANYQCV